MEVKSDKILDGKKVAEKVEDNLESEIKSLKEKGIEPGLTVVLVGNDPASQVYVSYKEKACKRVGINSNIVDLPQDVSQEDLLAEIEDLNKDEQVDGILVQLPLPEHIDEEKVIESIVPEKDVDGFHPANVGRLVTQGDMDLAPCTPKGIIEVLNEYNIDIEGKEAVIVGRSNIVGKPIANMLLHNNATVTICHSRTKDLKAHTSQADILIAAVGREEFITADMVKEGAIVIDVGINRTDDGLVGDVEFEAVKEKVAAITPVPGGIGPMTIATLLENTITACEQRRG
ncbi:bifunctional methylenetetrahydrofolate dehydrogenase/methenyltetrahydrofolate cyclohydrolase FolD [Halanaerobacter jeridensis]|uniref:Bifunctional protein FolD n=1 Tax=Halanaerobacter jeridensis TaxID=706427 RepID=A0A938XMZ9_9FIRM|nr:bifunctional methylenetetrahydrofolate dehydrogenase/methenyltetrahydrofolate cyclohydrolase FolD [Halanaerobacter jeridensis]MBM7555238.1 methylenetetrahydrofolate dehydrogenase (NADP+)/methenyltetrahydrofolate cyclohydrolase [Halanaerobacter jeridensis]